MTLADFRTLINSTFTANGVGGIDGAELRDALLELCNQIEADSSWSPVLSLVDNGPNKVVKITDWTGGFGVKPAINVYLTATGYNSDISLAVNVRGPQGLDGLPGGGFLTSLTATSDGLANPRYVPVFELPAETLGTNDWVRVLFYIGGWGSNRQKIELMTGLRGGFFYYWTSEGVITSGISIEAYVLSDNRVIYYIKSDNNFKYFTVHVLEYSGLTVSPYSSLSPISGTPTGTKIFDSANMSSYPPSRVITSTGLFGFGVSSPAEKVDINGRVKAKGLVSTGSLPTIAATTAGLGTTATATMTAGSNDLAGSFTLVSSAGSSSNNALATVTFNTAYSAAPVAIVITPRNAKAAEQFGRVYVSAITANGFTLSSAGTALSAPDTFLFQYHVIA